MLHKKKNVMFWRVIFYFFVVSRHCLIHHFDTKEPIQKQTRQNQTSMRLLHIS